MYHCYECVLICAYRNLLKVSTTVLLSSVAQPCDLCSGVCLVQILTGTQTTLTEVFVFSGFQGIRSLSKKFVQWVSGGVGCELVAHPSSSLHSTGPS